MGLRLYTHCSRHSCVHSARRGQYLSGAEAPGPDDMGVLNPSPITKFNGTWHAERHPMGGPMCLPAPGLQRQICKLNLHHNAMLKES